MTAKRPRLRSELEEAVLQLMPGWQVDGLGDFVYLSGGYSNENYRLEYHGEPFVLRIPERARPYVDRAQEGAFYQREHQVRIAELIAFDRLTGKMLTRFESGPLLSDSQESPASLVSYLQSLHTALPASGRSYDPVALSREFLAVGRPPAWVQALAAELDWVPAALVPCHNDLNPWNVIIKDSGPWVTLDWEWYGDNDPLFDLVTLHQGLGLSDEALEEMTRHWAVGGERTPEADHAVPGRLHNCLQAFWLREYAWAHAELCHGNQRPEISTQLATAADKLRLLQNAGSGGTR